MLKASKKFNLLKIIIDLYVKDNIIGIFAR